jgi:hypothetical protein
MSGLPPAPELATAGEKAEDVAAKQEQGDHEHDRE